MKIFKNMVGRTSLFMILASLILFCHLQSCKNPFETRNSPSPIIETEGTWDTPFFPQIAVQNLEHAYNEKIISNFDRCLFDSFTFSAPGDSIKAVQDNREELFANWDRYTEVSVTTKIFTTFRQNEDSISYDLFFDPVPPVSDDIGDTLAVLSRNYELFIVKSASPETTLAKGTATFHMKQTQLKLWSIYFWSDTPDSSGGYDWGAFKAEFR